MRTRASYLFHCFRLFTKTRTLEKRVFDRVARHAREKSMRIAGHLGRWAAQTRPRIGARKPKTPIGRDVFVGRSAVPDRPAVARELAPAFSTVRSTKEPRGSLDPPAVGSSRSPYRRSLRSLAFRFSRPQAADGLPFATFLALMRRAAAFRLSPAFWHTLEKYQTAGPPKGSPSASLALPGITEELLVKVPLASGGPAGSLILKYVTDAPFRR